MFSLSPGSGDVLYHPVSAAAVCALLVQSTRAGRGHGSCSGCGAASALGLLVGDDTNIIVRIITPLTTYRVGGSTPTSAACVHVLPVLQKLLLWCRYEL